MDIFSYLPLPLTAGFGVYELYKNESLSDKELESYNSCKTYLRTTALAIAGYVVFSKYGEQLGADLIPLTFVACALYMEAAKIAASGYFTVTGALALVDAARKRDVPGLTKNLALTVFAYFATTRKMDEWVYPYMSKPFQTLPTTNEK